MAPFMVFNNSKTIKGIRWKGMGIYNGYKELHSGCNHSSV